MMKNKTQYMNIKSLITMCVVTAFLACGPQVAKQKPVDPNLFEDGGFEYVFGKPSNFRVSAADLGATISYDANPTVSSYNLYMGEGSEENLDGIANAIQVGIESPHDVEKANIIRISSPSLEFGKTYYFATEAFNNEGTSSGLTDIRSITVRDLEGVEVKYRAKLFACVSGKTITRFTFKDGKMVLTYSYDEGRNEPTENGGFPGQGENKCEFEGVKLELQAYEGDEPSGPVFRFPEGTDGKKVFTALDQFIQIKDVDSSNSDIANLVVDEQMTVVREEYRKQCQGSGTGKYRVKVRDGGNGPVEDDDPIDTLEINTEHCARNNWTTFHNASVSSQGDNVIEFDLFFQTGQ